MYIYIYICIFLYIHTYINIYMEEHLHSQCFFVGFVNLLHCQLKERVYMCI